MTATDLIRRTRLLKSQMNKILTTLEGRGFISRTRAQEDRRMIHIRLTAEGKAAYLEQHKAVESILTQLIERIGAEHALSVAQDLSAITEILDEIVPLPSK